MRVKIRVFGLLILIMGSICQNAGSEEQIRLIEDGSTDYRIMLGTSSSPTEEFAAQELQGYLMQISGVFLPMAQRDAPAMGKLILVGASAMAKLELKVDESYPGTDGFVIKTVGDKIALAGGSPRGTLYSVYAFLEMLGCRWLAPGIIGEVIPRLPDIIIAPINHLERPNLTYRGFTSLIPVTRENVQWIDWMSKNRMNYLMIHPSSYVHFKEVLGGELERRGMYVGVIIENNPRVRGDEILKFIANNPEVDIIEIYTEPSGDIAKIAETDDAPSVKYLFEPTSRCYRHSMGDEQCEINSEARNHLKSQTQNVVHVYDHYMGSYGQNSLPFPILHTIASDLKYLKYFDELEKVEGAISQCEPGNWGTYGLNYYVFARMAWNADDDLGNIVDDYCEKYYGSASDPMKKYFARLEDAMAAMEHFRYVEPPQLILKLLDEKLLADLETDIQNAKSLAVDAISFDRIRKTQLSLNHARLLWYTLHHYSEALRLQESEGRKEAKERFQKAVEMGEELVSFLFQNIDEGVFIIPENYILDYLEPLIIDARNRKELLEAE